MKIFITGGAGFIGCNAARRFIADGHKVVIFDDLSRKGSDLNLKWLRSQGKFEFIKGDIRDFNQLKRAFRRYKETDVVLHLAAQVAVTLSITDPREDFEINALGSFNICEAVRQFVPGAVLLYASTNKVYGDMKEEKVIRRGSRYEYGELSGGIPETYPVDFHSPYGCSKGAADQYIKDYGRIYGLRSVCFRQSCIYGYRQMGMEDQGWVIWFIICALLNKPLTIYGDGMQVRDILFVEDLADAYAGAIAKIDATHGKTYNIGGGPKNALSLLELINLLQKIHGAGLNYAFAGWRPGDQKIFICDIQKAKSDFGWEPRHDIEAGIRKTYDWTKQNLDIFRKLYR
jgi:CDP-paratose 2-epimerase